MNDILCFFINRYQFQYRQSKRNVCFGEDFYLNINLEIVKKKISIT